ncbi:transporter substrate-binding domain-containing protein [Pelovirga terrestris]|uniref:Toxin CcdB n=1 Tax=Pelovirga terrestris TaxID=2771352 RepID=A0A8J6QQK2_9BACT|nr:transporter substrate-binding domain-containing protein [Pelovirga terrestris]
MRKYLRTFVPLVAITSPQPVISRLCPVFSVQGVEVMMSTPELAAYPLTDLGKKVMSASEQRHEIFAAIDFLLNGFCNRPERWFSMRKLLLLIMFIISSALPLPAAATDTPANRLDRVKQANVVRICIWPDYYSITYRNPKTLELSGIDIDMAKELGRDLDVAVAFVDSSFATLIDDVSQDRCDVAMFAIGITPARAEKLRFTRSHLASDIYGITTKTNRRIKEWGDIDSAGSMVAVAKGTLHVPVMKEKLKKAQLLVLDTPFAREQEVQSGRADVFMTDFPYSQRFLANADWARLVSPPETYHVTPYAYAMKLDDDVWHARMEQFVSDVKRDGRLRAAAERHKLGPIVVAP